MEHPSFLPAQRNFPAVRNAINEMKPSSIHRTIEDALYYAARCLPHLKILIKKSISFPISNPDHLNPKHIPGKISRNLFAPTAQFFLIPLGKRELQNVSVESILIPNTIFEVNKSFTVRAKLTNHGTSDLQNHVVSVYQDGIRVGQKGVDIRAGQSIETEFTVVPKHSGFMEGKLNWKMMILNLTICVFSSCIFRKNFMSFLSAVQPIIRISVSLSLPVSRQQCKYNNKSDYRMIIFHPSQLNNTDVVIFANVHDLTHEQSLALKTYLQNGGGMLFFPGSQSTWQLIIIPSLHRLASQLAREFRGKPYNTNYSFIHRVRQSGFTASAYFQECSRKMKQKNRRERHKRNECWNRRASANHFILFQR